MELKKDYTIVMVTHNMQQATRISDKTAFFLLGEVIEFNDTDTLFSMPADKKNGRLYYREVWLIYAQQILTDSYRYWMSSLFIWVSCVRVRSRMRQRR